MSWNDHYLKCTQAIAANDHQEAMSEYNLAIQDAMQLAECDRNTALNILSPIANLIKSDNGSSQSQDVQQKQSANIAQAPSPQQGAARKAQAQWAKVKISWWPTIVWGTLFFIVSALLTGVVPGSLLAPLVFIAIHLIRMWREFKKQGQDSASG